MQTISIRPEITGPLIKPSKLWFPKRVIIAADVYQEAYGKKMLERINEFNIPVEILKNNRETGLRGETERETYKLSKSTMVIVNAPAISI